MVNSTRTIAQVARQIQQEWTNVNYAAAPYLRSMKTLTDVNSMDGSDDAKSIVTYFLSNASSFRGGNAAALKKELKQLVGNR